MTTRQGRADAGRPATAPHPLLPAYYPSLDGRSDFVRSLFNRTAIDYDRISFVLSLGSGGWYRRAALRRAGLIPGMRVVDVAAGTGLVAREAVAITGDQTSVLALDLTENMLLQARRSGDMLCVQARAEAMPIAPCAVDFVSMGYALRHVSDLGVAFTEFRRVLRPGGRVVLLEIARPEGRLGLVAAKVYFRRLAPWLCRSTGSAGATELMRYYWDTIEACVPPPAILDALRTCGFVAVGCDTSLGIFRAYTATCPDHA